MLFDETKDYRTYLKSALAERAQGKRGERNRLAQFLRCQPAFVSQVLHGKAHFNLEHAAAVNHFLHHGAEEAHYFLLLLQKTRAGTEELRGYFEAQLAELRRKRLVLKQRFQIEDTLNPEDKSVYYSSWVYGAIRVLITIPEFRRREKIAERLRLPPEHVNRALEFLLSRQLVAEKKGELTATKRVMHLGNDSSMIAKHHANWRHKAISSLEFESERDLHYSSVVSLSREDALQLKKLFITALEKARAVVKESPEEEIFSIGIDFFSL